MDKGTLYIVSTPIGNLSDITFRAVEVLKNADAIAAEDTRHTLKLLNSLGIKNRLISFHEYSDPKKAQYLIDMLIEGKSLALVTDAGTPLISDPGSPLISLAYENEVQVTAVPGACAAVTALTLSGMSCARFVFEGFIPRDSSRKQVLERVKNYDCTCVLYESPHQLLKTLFELYEYCGDRNIAICKELTKMHENVERLSLKEAVQKYSELQIKGEYVLVLEGAVKEETKITDEDITAALQKCIESGETKKSAVKTVSQMMDVPKNRVYQLMLNMD